MGLLHNFQNLQFYKCDGGHTLRSTTRTTLTQDLFQRRSMQLFVKSCSGRTLVLQTHPSVPILNLKSSIEQREGLCHTAFFLSFGSKCLRDELLVQDYGLQPDSTLHMSLRALGGAKGKGKGKGKDKKDKKGKKSPRPGSGENDAAGSQLSQENFDQLRRELDHERMERNYFQLERDKINTFWEITKKELEERHQVEIKVYKQKVKHLLYEHQNNVATLKSEGEAALKLQQDEHRQREAELKKDKRSLKLELKELELAHEDVIRELKQEHDKNITKLRQEYERTVKEMQQKYERKMRVLRDELDLRRKVEIFEIEERKNNHINELMKKHEKAFGEIKNYYNDITHNNLDLIRSLKDEVADMKKKEAAKELANYQKDKMSLQNAKSRLH